ncbi:ABC transporter substrate-binding protein [Demequina sp.]|uniref:ABC transporter substrate-binding protein n=1 Tax=Demequina sp. TaxID=2050685 RepID=UPI0025FBBC53|nr:ABC transporter substrate-binding protein [Demequina sp.]
MTLRHSRIVATAALAAVTALALAACSSGGSAEPSSSASAPAAAGTESAFPVTVEGMYGDVTVASEPQRVVTLGSREHELLYALGVAPVAIPISWQGYEYGTGPWAEADRVAAGAEPELFDATTIDAETIAAFEPDLIVGTYTNITQEEYDLLSGIAPVIVRGAQYDPWGMPLDAELTLIGEATGTSGPAQEAIAEIDDAFASARAAHPDWEGKTGVVGFYYEGNPGVYLSSDNRNQFLANLGLDVTALDEYADSSFVTISSEKLDLLDTDLVIWQSATTPDVRATIEGLPLFDSIGVTQKGGNLWIEDTVLEGAFFANSPSSILYSLDALLPGLEAALDGDPGSDVPVFSDPSA